MPSSHLTEPQEACVSHAVERLLALPEESARRFFLKQNPQLRLQDNGALPGYSGSQNKRAIRRIAPCACRASQAGLRKS